MSDDSQQPIIVKRIKKTAAGAHGGAWKIAYADFVTAMMAFFLMMWLLGSTAQGDLQGIADQFQNPLKLSMRGGEGTGDSSSIIKGGGEDLSRKVGQVRRGDTPSTRAINVDATKHRNRGPGSDPEGIEMERRRERARLIDLKGRIEALIEANTQLRMFRNQILIDIISEGLRIQIVEFLTPRVLLPHPLSTRLLLLANSLLCALPEDAALLSVRLSQLRVADLV